MKLIKKIANKIKSNSQSTINKDFHEFIEMSNKKTEKFEKANPQFKERTSKLVPNTLEEIDKWETIYNNLELGSYEYDNLDFKATDSYKFKDIFSSHWEPFIEANPNLNIRDVVHKEIEKMIHCQDPNLGHGLYECSDCHESIFVPFTCKSRFCPTCAMKYQIERADAIHNKLLDCKHRHMVFTIPKQLRYYFRKYRSLLNVLFKAVQSTIDNYIQNNFKNLDLKAGTVLTLHTFGRDMKWNPHIHALVTEGGMSNKKNATNFEVWKNINYFNYAYLRHGFKYYLLKYMKDALKKLNISDDEMKKFKKLCNELYELKDGFYVNAEPSKKGIKKVINYIVRYFNRPVMATSRILHIEGDYIVYYYQRHEDNKYIIEKVHIFDFFKMLIIHIPDENFKMIRYGGIYTSHEYSNLNRVIEKLGKIADEAKKIAKTWRDRIKLMFKRDPIKCPNCGNTMKFKELIIAKNTS